MNQLELNAELPENRITLFADIILPVPLPKLYTYRVPYIYNDAIQPGCRVIVQFGRKKVLTGIVGLIHRQPPKHYEAKYISELLDETPMVNAWQLQLFQWMADYYMCTLGEVMNISLPSGLKLSSQSKIQLHPEFNSSANEFAFTEKEYALLACLKIKDTITYTEAGDILGNKNPHQMLKSLIQKEAVLIYEEVKEKYKPKVVKKIRLSKKYVENKKLLEDLFKSLAQKPKQEDVLLKYLQQIPVYQSPALNERGVLKNELIQNETSGDKLSLSSLNTLIKNEILEEFEEVQSRFGDLPANDEYEIVLNAAQLNARNEILDHFKEKDAVLFHGITGSGKTEIYVDLIRNALEAGSQVLYLLPEIALTTQIVSRLRKIFGDTMGVYHSMFSDNERVEVWKGIISGKFSFVVGVRSSVLLPFDNLGLIIIDEEHENSYKQYDPAPRYHARDLALVMARLHHAKTLLGSATPSVESYYNARSGKYGLVTLKTRFGDAQLPEITLADVSRERKRKTMQGEFTSELMAAVRENTSRKEQTIIFQNRRGYAPYISCEECAWIPKCDSCSVSLTYHMYSNELRCHYCGYKEKIPGSCMACGSTKLKMVGFGTEKLEEEIKQLLPGAKVQRMDLDTTRRKYSYQTIIDNFEKGTIDILIGTQMVSKGLDFDKVSLVGILDADRMIHFPDFRSHERTFQLVTQVSGRAGRREKKGKVIIQTAQPEHPVLQKILANEYEEMYLKELQEREKFNYPPFVRLISVTIKNQDKAICAAAAEALKNLLSEDLGKKRVLGPHEPIINKIRNQFLNEIFIKLERDKINLNKTKEIIKKHFLEISTNKRFKNTLIVPDVDPV